MLAAVSHIDRVGRRGLGASTGIFKVTAVAPRVSATTFYWLSTTLRLTRGGSEGRQAAFVPHSAQNLVPRATFAPQLEQNLPPAPASWAPCAAAAATGAKWWGRALVAEVEWGRAAALGVETSGRQFGDGAA